jgi:hypothetical protein
MKTLGGSSSSRLRESSPSINISIYTKNMPNVRLSKTPHRQDNATFDFTNKPMPSSRIASNFQNYVRSEIPNAPKMRIKSVQKSKKSQNATLPTSVLSTAIHSSTKERKPLLKFDVVHFDKMRAKKK